jgi:DNA-binding MarR family transcriptional regulator
MDSSFLPANLEGILMSKRPCTKFRQSSLNIAVAILRGLRDGLYPAEIARRIKRRRNLVHYYVSKMESMGFVEKQEGVVDCINARGAINLYRLTQSGSIFLAGIERNVQRCQVRLHNCYWRYPIIEQPLARIDWRRVELQNWGQLIGRELGLTVRKNTKSVEIISGIVTGDNPYELLLRSRDEADRLALYLERKFRMKLGRPKLGRKPHFAMYDPVACKWAESLQLDSENGKIDKSCGYGEIDWTDPVSAYNYLSMPDRLERIEKSMEVFAVGMQQHMLLIKELRETVRALKNIIGSK